MLISSISNKNRERGIVNMDKWDLIKEYNKLRDEKMELYDQLNIAIKSINGFDKNKMEEINNLIFEIENQMDNLRLVIMS